MKSTLIALLVIVLGFGSTCGAFEVLVYSAPSPAGPPSKWLVFPVAYSVDNRGTQGISSNAVVSNYKKVIGIINKNAGAQSLSRAALFSYAGKTSSVQQGDLKNGVVFDLNAGLGSFILAVQRLRIRNGTEFVEGDLIFNDEVFNFTTGPSVVTSNPQSSKFNMFTTMLHEMTHSASLNHTAMKNQVMFFQQLQDYKTLQNDDVAGVKFVHQPTVAGASPKNITPIDNSVHSLSSIGQAANALTFRWKGSTSAAKTANGQAAATYTLICAGDAAFTKNVTRFDAKSAEAFYSKGQSLKKLKKIQNASPTREVFWKVEEKAGGTKTSSAFSFKFD